MGPLLMETHLKPHPGGLPRTCCVAMLALTVAAGLVSILAYLWHVGMLYIMDR